MEEKDDILDITQSNEGAKRPAFITVLCILTFVGAGFGILGAFWSMITMSAVQDTMDSLNRMSDTFGDSSINDGMEDFYRWTKISAYLNLLGNAMCLTGALLMWNLKKVGYFIYVPGQIIPFFGAIMVVTSMVGTMGSMGPAGGLFGSLGMMGLVIGSLFPLAFIIMYGVNLKHMK